MEMPFKDPDLNYVYVSKDHPGMMRAEDMAYMSNCYKQRTGAAIYALGNEYDGGELVAVGNNHVATPQDSCPRQDMETGTGYELCKDACGGNLHAEVAAIMAMQFDDIEFLSSTIGFRPKGLYLYGHWWCCPSCCTAMKEAGITTVFLVWGCGPDTKWF